MSIIFKRIFIFLPFLFLGFTSKTDKIISYDKISHIIREIDLNQKVILVSIKDQKLYILYKKKIINEFEISSSKFGVGFDYGSQKTPLGMHYIKKKIGDDVPINGIFKYRQFSGQLSIPNHPNYIEKDLITTRILWLSGNEEQNQLTYKRCIYIHGTPEEFKIGKPSSHGCIRMRNVDIYALYEFVEKGTLVLIQ